MPVTAEAKTIAARAHHAALLLDILAVDAPDDLAAECAALSGRLCDYARKAVGPTDPIDPGKNP